jgi:hypothetical protein
MKKLVLAAAAAGTVLVGGAAVANAQWSLGNRDAVGVQTGDYSSTYARGNGAECGFVTVREHRDGQTVVRRVPRC